MEKIKKSAGNLAAHDDNHFQVKETDSHVDKEINRVDSTLETICINSLAKHIGTELGKTLVVDHNKCQVPELELEFLALNAESRKLADNCYAVSVTFEARSPHFESGIAVFITGLGTSELNAATEAGHQWVTGVFSVISQAFQYTQTTDLPRVKMMVSTQNTNETFGWFAYLGSVIGRVYGGYGTLDETDLDPVAAFMPIFPIVQHYAVHHQVMWVESFVAKYAADQIDVTCRLNNNDWADGQQALLTWACGWPDKDKLVVSKRQFILFRPMSPAEMQENSDLKVTADQLAVKRKAWWQKILPFGG